jgi:uncharacterized protein YfaS (alpha-2-macroglobulin family)
VARKDVIMRLETPRFVTQGDTVTLSGIVHNYLNADKSTQISLEVNGAQLQNSGKQTVTISKQGEHRIDWQISAPNVGEIKLLAKALTDTESDAVELPLTVVPRGLHQVKNESAAFSDENAEKTYSLNLPANAGARAQFENRSCAFSCGHIVWRAGLPDHVSIWLHRADDVELSSERDRFAGIDGCEVVVDKRFK